MGKIEGWERDEGKVRETRLYPLFGWGGKMCEWSSEGEVFHLAEKLVVRGIGFLIIILLYSLGTKPCISFSLTFSKGLITFLVPVV